MFRPVLWVVALLGLVLSAGIVSAAEASPAAPTSVTGPVLGTMRIGAPQMCLNDHTQGSGIPFFTAGDRWDDNAAVTLNHESQVAGDDCNTAGFHLGVQLEVFLVNSDQPGCWHWFYTYTTDSDGNQWRMRTIAYLHANKLSCWSTATRKANAASKIIGLFLGAAQFENTTISVMGTNTDDTVPYPIWYDLDTINDHYWFWRKA